MRGLLDTVLYALTAPIRLFGRSPRLRLAIGALAIVALFFSASRCGRSTASCRRRRQDAPPRW